MFFLSPSRRYENAVKTFRFSLTTLPRSMLSGWENRSRVFRKSPWMRSPGMHGRAIFGNYRTSWSTQRCYLAVHRCACRWVKFLMTQASARPAGAMRWSEPGESRLCEHSAKAIGSSEVFVERQLAWGSREHRSPTRCRSWGSLAHRSDGRGFPSAGFVPVTDQERRRGFV